MLHGKTAGAAPLERPGLIILEDRPMKKSTKIIIAVAALVGAAAILLAAYLGTRPETAAGDKTIEVEVVHGDGSQKTFTYDTDAEYLGQVLQDEGLIQGEESQYGLYITAVDGEEAVYETDGAYWALYEGEDYAQQGIDETPIADGGQYSLVYTVG